MSVSDNKTNLRYLDALLTHGSFTKAAKNLYISQPYLTQIIKRIEQDLTIEILDRQTSPLQLTTAGKLYYQYLETLEQENNTLLKQLARYTYTNQTSLRIAILPSLGAYLLPKFLPEYHRLHPTVQLILEENTPRVNEARLLTGEVDFYIGQSPEMIDPSLAIHSVGMQTYYALIPKNSELFKKYTLTQLKKTLPIQELLRYPLLLTTNGSAIRRQVDLLFQKYAVEPTILLESQNIYTIAALAKEQMGIAIIPESLALQDQHEDCVYIPINHLVLSLNYFIAYQKNMTLTSAEETFISLFLTKIAQLIPQHL